MKKVIKNVFYIIFLLFLTYSCTPTQSKQPVRISSRAKPVVKCQDWHEDTTISSQRKEVYEYMLTR